MTTPATPTASTRPATARAGRNLVAGLLLGLGTVAFIDETVFHQLLHWHHFYDRSTSEVGLVSDGLFHAFSWFATVASLFLVADLRREGAFWGRRFVAGWLAGAGFFQQQLPGPGEGTALAMALVLAGGAVAALLATVLVTGRSAEPGVRPA